MLERLREIERRYEEISSLLADPEVLKDPTRYAELAKEHANLGGIVEPYGRLKEILASLEESSSMLEDPDPEIRSLAREELAALEREKELLETRIRCLLLPRDPNDERHVILEIRAGTGGDEAALFAADLFRMYCRYAEEKGWDVEILSANETGIGGFKEVIAGIRGRGAYSRLKYESGVHRVQRVPVTEASGRIHTSAVTVAVLPEAEEVDVAIDPNDLRIETFRASGAGGQHVNKTESAIRITHLPTGIVVSCQDEKSQHKNKAKALRVIRSRILQKMQEDQAREIATQRRMQVGTGDRSERIRTYNFPQGRVTDHRVNLTLHRLQQVLEGDIDEIVDALAAHEQAEVLRKTGS
ncbi:MAG TPA: peptide chain release factor 1 [Deltaproteobacteria bacterium]|nr:peptide chain release factor 1 [Deltaproteobacteria bacterium]